MTNEPTTYAERRQVLLENFTFLMLEVIFSQFGDDAKQLHNDAIDMWNKVIAELNKEYETNSY